MKKLIALSILAVFVAPAEVYAAPLNPWQLFIHWITGKQNTRVATPVVKEKTYEYYPRLRIRKW